MFIRTAAKRCKNRSLIKQNITPSVYSVVHVQVWYIRSKIFAFHNLDTKADFPNSDPAFTLHPESRSRIRFVCGKQGLCKRAILWKSRIRDVRLKSGLLARNVFSYSRSSRFGLLISIVFSKCVAKVVDLESCCAKVRRLALTVVGRALRRE